ncbi:hypothetical protein [Arcobacter sp. CECT 8985]|uniref:hypothetical protein n=1 Tax=Arcobacter sp. CECT 8985 TaxID=1935424 RepID=UPI00100B3E6A|nr:hypothetical protein [Arcobacter sp. CECT 8985]RXJ84278.1 hypothetical protein CRU93_12695 [Arcobacter sp. CECT 8985]
MSNSEICEIIYKQLDKITFNELTDGKTCDIKDFKEYMIKDNNEGFKGMFKTELENKIIEFKDITFTKENKYIIDKLYKIKFFDNCIFEFDFKINSEKTYYFEKCKFSNKLIIKSCNLFDENELFDNCDINKIEINDEEINFKLFNFCKINKLNANRVIFKKKPFFDTFNNLFKRKNINEQVYKNLNFYDCKFEKEFFIGQKSRIDTLKFLSCSFFSKLNISVEYPIEKLKIQFCTLNNKVDISKNIIKKDLCIENSIFNENIILDNSNVDGLLLKENIFNKLFSMADTKIDFFISEKDSFEMLNLRRTNFNKLDLEKIHYIGKSDLLGIEGKIQNRETARIIKDSFEQQNNIIEANKYYAIEMKKREEELTKDLKEGKNFFEWLVFKVHGISSNHSQDWLLALFWIISFTFSIGMITNDFEKYHISFINLIPSFFIFIMSLIIASIQIEFKNILLIIFGFISYGLYSIISCDFNLYNVTNHINPFSVMDSWKNITFSELIYKIIIAYLIYQLIISIRQNTRRK